MSTEDETREFLVNYTSRENLKGCFVVGHLAAAGKGFYNCAFAHDDVGGMLKWFDQYNRVNIYISVNTFNLTPGSKTGRTLDNIAQLLAVYGDLDAEGGRSKEDLLKDVVPKLGFASYIVDSGHGYQFQHFLQDPLEPTPDNRARAKATREIFIQKFGCDSGANDDARVLRVPGGFNAPTPEKAKRKGYSLDLVPTLLVKPVDPTAVRSISNAPIHVEGEITTRADGDRNLTRVLANSPIHPELVELIQTGNIEDAGEEGAPAVQRYDDRSAARAKAILGLIKWFREDELVAEVIMHPDHDIGEGAREKGYKHTVADIARLRRKMMDGDLFWFKEISQRYRTALVGNKPLAFDTRNTDNFTPMALSDFKQHADEGVPVHNAWSTDPRQAQFKKRGSLFIDSPLRHQYDGVTMRSDLAPWTGDEQNRLNTFLGTIESRHPASTDHSTSYWVRPFLNYLRDVLCCGDRYLYKWLVRWIARTIQHPCAHAEVAVALVGPKGYGKSTMGVFIRNMFPQAHTRAVANYESLTKFNGWMQQCCLLELEEAVWAGSHQQEAYVKNLLTNEKLFGELKGVQGFQYDNMLSVVITSNEARAVPATNDDRRWFILDVDLVKRPRSYWDDLYGFYFQKINKESGKGTPGVGLECLLHFLKQVDLSTFDFRDPPKTAGLQSQASMNFKPHERLVRTALVNGYFDEEESGFREQLAGGGLHMNWIPNERLYQLYQRECKHHEDALDRTQFGREVRKLLGDVKQTKNHRYDVWGGGGLKAKKGRAVCVMDVEDARKHFSEVMQAPNLFDDLDEDDYMEDSLQPDAEAFDQYMETLTETLKAG